MVLGIARSEAVLLVWATFARSSQADKPPFFKAALARSTIEHPQSSNAPIQPE